MDAKKPRESKAADCRAGGELLRAGLAEVARLQKRGFASKAAALEKRLRSAQVVVKRRGSHTETTKSLGNWATQAAKRAADAIFSCGSFADCQAIVASPVYVCAVYACAPRGVHRVPCAARCVL